MNQTKTEIHLKINNETKIYKKADILEVDYADTRPAAPVEIVRPKPEPAPAKPEPTPTAPSLRPLNQYDLVWRSALLPGWGQYRVQRKKWAFLEGPSTLLFLGYALGERTKALAAKKSYEASVIQSFFLIQSTVKPGASPSDALVKQFALGLGPYNAYQSQVARYNTSIQLLSAVYLGQLVHGWFMGKKNARSETPVMAFGFALFPESDRPGRIGSFVGLHFRY